ncbi:MAG: hypothetical protein OFPI_19290 [Osedax symbiont Rs2]|nr:MAG: hypothetical protein OFPI_19290 [Osedax symbiont Rs2]
MIKNSFNMRSKLYSAYPLQAVLAVYWLCDMQLARLDLTVDLLVQFLDRL